MTDYVILNRGDLERFREATAERRAADAYWRLWEAIYDKYGLPAAQDFSIGMVSGHIFIEKEEARERTALTTDDQRNRRTSENSA